jgi:hypothetical protein
MTGLGFTGTSCRVGLVGQVMRMCACLAIVVAPLVVAASASGAPVLTVSRR